MWNRKAAVSGLAVAAVAFAGACSDNPPTEPRAIDGDFQLFAAPQNPAAGADNTYDVRLARIAEAVPGYGGHFFDENGALNVYMTGMAQARTPAAVRQALGSRLAALGVDVNARDVRVLTGRYDFAQLNAMHREVTQVLGLDGVVFTDAQERTNLIEIGVENAAAASAVRRALGMMSVPSEAVVIREVEPIRFMQGLRDRVRPVAAGLQINFPGFVCTIGFNVRSPSAPNVHGFVTNSHCSAAQWDNVTSPNTPYWQPSGSVANPSDPNFIAREEWDAPGYTGGNCPAGRICRNSDAAGARYAPGIPNAFARIYRTTSVNTGNWQTIDQANPMFHIVAEAPTNQPVGTIVDKVGRTTGWSSGSVSNSCVNTGVSGTQFTVMCQDWVSGANNIVAGGDSGSGAFTRLGTGADPNVRLNGILWGGGTGVFVYSPMERVRMDNPPPPGVQPWRTF